MAQSISFQHAVALARSGDPEAQYALSSVLHQRKQFDDSLHWLRLAAAAGLIPAQVTLAILLTDGRRCPRDRRQAIGLLEPLAPTQVQANLLLSELHGFSALGGADPALGLRYLAGAARLGDAGALRQLALLSACHQRWDLVRPLLGEAARGGDAYAAHALNGCSAPDSTESEGGPGPPATAATPVDWPRVEEALPHLAAPMVLPPARTLHESPLIRKIPGAIHPLVLDFLIRLAAPLVTRSQIVDARTGEARADPMRSSSHVTLGPRQHDHVLEALESCIGRIADAPSSNGEFLQILRYQPGEEFKPHVDYFNEGGAGTYQSLADGGQRAQTVLLYLNDDYSGGSTHFPTLRLDIKGRRGDLLHFRNLGPDGLGNRNTLHAGMPVMAGEKWLLSQWIRSDHYPARRAW